MASRRARRSFSRRWLEGVRAAHLGAFAVATAEALFLLQGPALGSALGIVFAWSMTFALFTGYALAWTSLLALLGLARVKRVLARSGDVIAFAIVWSIVAMTPLALLERVFAPAWEFPREMRAMHTWLSFGALASVLALAYATRARLAGWIASHVSWRARRRFGAFAIALASLAGVASAHLLLAPESLVVPCGYVGALTLLLAAVASSSAARPARSIREAAPALACSVVATAMWLVPGAARDHGRFLLWNHGAMAAPMAELVREALDRDHDGSSPAWLGGTDCAEGDAKRGPLLREIPGDGVDQDCRGGDAPPVTPPPPATFPADCHLPPTRLSVLLITIDALRADHTTIDTMPVLADLALHSATFTRAYSPTGLTVTSMAATLTARPLADMVDNALKDDQLEAPFTIASLFKSAGYRTAAFTEFETHALHLRGFDHLNDPWVDLSPIGTKETLTSGALARATLHFATAPGGAPFFAWLHFADVHARYKFDHDDEGHALSESAAYDRGIAYVGTQLTNLLRGMQEHGLFDRTVIVVTADHGEELMARGREGHGPNVYEESIHVPLVVWVPGCAPRVVESPVGLTQVGPTLGAITGVRVPGWGLFDARPLPVVTEATVGYDTQFKRAVVGARYKLIVDAANGGRVLFDLDADPGEGTNVYGANADARAQMESAYQRWLDSPGAR